MKMGMKHSAYNLVTKEVLACSTSRGLKDAVKQRSKINRAEGLKNKWVFTHNGVDGLVVKIKKDQVK